MITVPPLLIFCIISCQQEVIIGEMARFMLLSRLRSSIFSGVYARSNPPLNTMQLCRSRSNPQALFSRHAHDTSIPWSSYEPSTRIPFVWIEIKCAKARGEEMVCKITKKITEKIYYAVVSVVVY